MMKCGEARVAWVTPVLGVASSLLYWAPLLTGFAGRCSKLRVFTAECRANTDGIGLDIELCGRLKRIYDNERYIDTARTEYSSGISIVGPALIHRLRVFDPELVILNEFGMLTFYGLCFKPRRARTLLIVESRPCISGGAPLRLARTFSRRVMAAAADAVLTNNQTGYQYLVQDLRVRPDKIVCKPYLVSAPPDSGADRAGPGNHPVPPPTESAPIHFLYVGQLIQRKGLQYALGACSLLLAQHRRGFRLDVVGDGPFRQDLESLVDTLGLRGQVLFHGRQTYEVLQKFYRQAQVFLFPTLSDYRSLTPFEALSFGLPLIASIHDGGVVETVIEGSNGYACDPKDTERLAGLMAIFIDNPEIIPRFSQSSRELSTHYTVERAVEALVEAADLALMNK